MNAAKYAINGSDCVGAFALATDKYVFVGRSATEGSKKFLSTMLGVEAIDMSIGGMDFIGVLARANSNGMLVSNLATDREIDAIRSMKLGINIEVLSSTLNAVGNNMILNDKVAIVNPEYSRKDMAIIEDVFGVEVIGSSIGSFKTVGANDVLTNKGLVINNHASDEEKEKLDKETGFDSVRSTANMGSLGVGIAVVANSNGALIGDTTTGYEFSRIVDGLYL
ncbi:MAG: translation initiation factor IF-6 [Candidatus Micrarchaeaceae archaeon]|nr:translation initiation factor IF-6 [Candidatus Marsarchaeota archaeon]